MGDLSPFSPNWLKRCNSRGLREQFSAFVPLSSDSICFICPHVTLLEVDRSAKIHGKLEEAFCVFASVGQFESSGAEHSIRKYRLPFET